MLSSTSHLPAFSATMVSVPSPFELMAYPDGGSNTTPSDPAPIAGVASTLPESGSDTTITRFEQTENSRRPLGSIARPEGSSQPVSAYFLTTDALAVSMSTISFVSSMLTNTCPLPSATENS